MKLTPELKNKMYQYFTNIEPDKLVDDLVNNFGVKQIKSIKLAQEKGYVPYFKNNLYKREELLMEYMLLIYWIKDNYGYWTHYIFPLNSGKYEWVIFDLNSPLPNNDGYKNYMSINNDEHVFDSPEEATENMLCHLLTKMI
jgi:hypothetical protein